MSTISRLVTAEELFRMPSNNMRHELVKGELRTMPPSGGEHGVVGIYLSSPLGVHVKAHRLGLVFGAETGFILARNPDTVRAPDIAFIRTEKIPASGIPKGFWPGAPDLAVEVISPGDTLVEVEEKVQEWLEAGASLVWVVNPRHRKVTVYSSPTAVTILTAKDELDGQLVVPGFHIRVGEIFA